jgi:acetate kinase
MNTGSSSLKWSILNAKLELELSSGIAERIGAEQGLLKLTGLEQASRQEKLALPDHRSALHLAIVHPEIDPKLNDQNGKNSDGRITTGSGLLCLVIPTNEELMIARETDRLVP